MHWGVPQETQGIGATDEDPLLWILEDLSRRYLWYRCQLGSLSETRAPHLVKAEHFAVDQDHRRLVQSAFASCVEKHSLLNCGKVGVWQLTIWLRFGQGSSSDLLSHHSLEGLITTAKRWWLVLSYKATAHRWKRLRVHHKRPKPDPEWFWNSWPFMV